MTWEGIVCCIGSWCCLVGYVIKRGIREEQEQNAIEEARRGQEINTIISKFEEAQMPVKLVAIHPLSSDTYIVRKIN